MSEEFDGTDKSGLDDESYISGEKDFRFKIADEWGCWKWHFLSSFLTDTCSFINCQALTTQATFQNELAKSEFRQKGTSTDQVNIKWMSSVFQSNS